MIPLLLIVPLMAPTISDIKFDPERGKKFEPVELSFNLKADFKNPFDVKQIDAHFLITGPQDLSAEQPAFYCQDYDVVTRADGTQTVVAKGSPTWKMRFAPWRQGVYSLFPVAVDPVGRFDGKKIDVRADDSTFAPFITVKEKEQYFRIDKEALFPIITEFKRDARQRYDFAAACQTARQSGANTLFVNLGSQFRLEPSLGQYDMAEFWAVDQLIAVARKQGLYLLLALEDGASLTKNWATNPYNAKNGGPCAKSEEFWTSIKARIAYKNKIRHLVSRITANNNLLGVQFFAGIQAPDYWVLEMMVEFLAHHTYGVPMSSAVGDSAFWKLKQTGFACIEIEPAPTAAQTAERIANAVSETKKLTDKPILCELSKQGINDDVAGVSAWASLVSGASSAIVPEGSRFGEAVAEYASRVGWLREKRTAQRLAAPTNSFAQAFVGNGGGIALFAGQHTAGDVSLEIGVNRDKQYRVEWFDIQTGATLATGEFSSDKRILRLTVPHSAHGSACIFR
ncbi:MAG: DUF5060 domain-containing protein [Fimbriimonadales bacterium]